MILIYPIDVLIKHLLFGKKIILRKIISKLLKLGFIIFLFFHLYSCGWGDEIY